jgi:predicted nucleic acid-binding protein
MTFVVLDASAALAFLVPGQSTQASEAFRLGASQFDLIAPVVFAWEVRHALIKLERRNQIRLQTLDIDLPKLEAITRLMPSPTQKDLSSIIALARSEELGLYDASYLAVAMEQDCPLASRDGKLLAVAIKRGVDVVDCR